MNRKRRPSNRKASKIKRFSRRRTRRRRLRFTNRVGNSTQRSNVITRQGQNRSRFRNTNKNSSRTVNLGRLMVSRAALRCVKCPPSPIVAVPMLCGRSIRMHNANPPKLKDQSNSSFRSSNPSGPQRSGDSGSFSHFRSRFECNKNANLLYSPSNNSSQEFKVRSSTSFMPNDLPIPPTSFNAMTEFYERERFSIPKSSSNTDELSRPFFQRNYGQGGCNRRLQLPLELFSEHSEHTESPSGDLKTRAYQDRGTETTIECQSVSIQCNLGSASQTSVGSANLNADDLNASRQWCARHLCTLSGSLMHSHDSDIESNCQIQVNNSVSTVDKSATDVVNEEANADVQLVKQRSSSELGSDVSGIDNDNSQTMALGMASNIVNNEDGGDSDQQAVSNSEIVNTTSTESDDENNDDAFGSNPIIVQISRVESNESSNIEFALLSHVDEGAHGDGVHNNCSVLSFEIEVHTSQPIIPLFAISDSDSDDEMSSRDENTY